MRSRLRLQYFYFLEAALVGLFFIQSLRFLIGIIYSRTASASLAAVLDPSSIPLGTTGVVSPDTANGEIIFLIYMLALPILALFIGRIRLVATTAVVLASSGRMLMNSGTTSPAIAAALTVGGALLFLSVVIRHRAYVVPYFFIVGLGVDQVLRAAGNTLDISWSLDYYPVQLGLSVAVILVSVGGFIWQNRSTQSTDAIERGVLPFWGGIGMAGLLFLQITLLSLHNAVAARAQVDYTTFAPLILLATLLPLLPWVRQRARSILNMFDGSARGWLWMLLTALLLVFGTRLSGPMAGGALVIAQFTSTLLWWWIIRPQAERERNLTGIWVILAILMFGVLIAGDIFTYEYAFVRNFSADLAFLNPIFPPLLRGFRGFGLGLILLGAFFAALPMVQTPRRIAWNTSNAMSGYGILGMIFIVGLTAITIAVTSPPTILGIRNVDRIRAATYNIHSGYSEFFAYNLEQIAQTIERSGADVVLLQQVESGRVTSFGVDQPLWLARRLNMDVRFFPANEGLQGLAVLSRVEIVYSDGSLLASIGNQTGVQRVQIRPDDNIVTLYNTWLGFLLDIPGERPIADQEQDQIRQINEVFTLISSHHPNGVLGRTILGGTFNNVQDSPLVSQIRATGFGDPFAGLPIELSATLVRTTLRDRVDYLWTRNLLAVGANVIDSSASDHRLAVIEVLLAR